MEPIKKLFFFHNPKAGGSSMRQLLSNLKFHSYAPIIENCKVDHEEVNGNYESFKGYSCYMGHYGRDIFSVVNDNHVYITNFRHPITRILSIYNYFRFSVEVSAPELLTEKYFAVRFAKTVDFNTFVSTNDPRINVYIQNAHFRQLTNSGWSLNIMDTLMQACHFIDQMTFYSVCEYPQPSLHWFKKILSTDIFELPRVNVTKSHSDKMEGLQNINDNILAELYNKNTLDVAIYNYAVDRLLYKITPTLIASV